ncbi:MAG: Hsp33 family molecular chaperone HslO [Bdellovibrionales bacterium]
MPEALPEKIKRYVSHDMLFRAAIVNATHVVREMQTIQSTYPVATMAVGRSMVAASLMASQLKPQNMISLYFRGDGPLEMFFAEASYEGEVRGYTSHPQLEVHKKLGSVNIGLAIGKGLLTVVRTTPNQKNAHRGSVEIQTGEVGDDLAFYLMQSLQTRSIVSLGVKVNAFGLVESAGGILIELMPGAPEELVKSLESNFAGRVSLSESLADGATTRDICDMYLKGFNLVDLEHPYSLEYKCRCSKERLANALMLLGHFEVEKMIEEQEPARAKCEFCGRQYTLEIKELEELLDKLRAGISH